MIVLLLVLVHASCSTTRNGPPLAERRPDKSVSLGDFEGIYENQASIPQAGYSDTLAYKLMEGHGFKIHEFNAMSEVKISISGDGEIVFRGGNDKNSAIFTRRYAPSEYSFQGGKIVLNDQAVTTPYWYSMKGRRKKFAAIYLTPDRSLVFEKKFSSVGVTLYVVPYATSSHRFTPYRKRR